MNPRPNRSQPAVSKADIVDSHISRDVVVRGIDISLTRDLVRFAVEQIHHTIEMAEQRNHIPHGLRTYAAHAVALLARLQ